MKRVETSVRSPAGLEWTIFRNLPRITFLSATILAILRTLLGIAITLIDGANVSKSLQILDFTLIGIGVTLLLLLVFIGLACGIILVAKGPQYTADSYEVNDADVPS